MIKYEFSQSNHCTQRTWNDNQVKNPEGRCESKFGTKPILSLNKKKKPHSHYFDGFTENSYYCKAAKKLG